MRTRTGGHDGGAPGEQGLREGSAARTAAVLTRGLRDVVRLVLPVECPGCGLWDETLCAPCAAALDGPVLRCEEDVPRLDRMDGSAPLPVWTVAAYAGPVRGIVVSWKDRGRADLTPRLVATARRAGAGLAPELAAMPGMRPGAVVHVVPVPSSASARRRRGADLVRLLAAGTVAGLRAQGVPAELAPVLVRRRGGRDQVGLGARARGRNTAGSVRVRVPPGDVLARWVDRPTHPGRADRVTLLVDDIVTTGSTLATCQRVLSGSGGLVLGAVVIAATSPPSRDRGRLLRTPSEG